MLTYLLGDVLRIFAGDFEAGKTAGAVTPWLGLFAHEQSHLGGNS
jgi:hypothetical protein